MPMNPAKAETLMRASIHSIAYSERKTPAAGEGAGFFRVSVAQLSFNKCVKVNFVPVDGAPTQARASV
jgi:hypothetical protein